MALTSVLPSGISLPPPNSGDRGTNGGSEALAKDPMAAKNLVTTMAEKLRAPWRREGLTSPRWDAGVPRPWRRPKRNDTADTLSTAVPSTETMSAMPSPSTRPSTAVTLSPLAPATPHREASELEEDSSQGFSPKCPPGCIDPSISRRVGPPFTRMPQHFSRYRRKLDPLLGGALSSIGSDTSSPPESLSPRTRAVPFRLELEDSLADEMRSDVHSARQTVGSRTQRGEAPELEDEATSMSSRAARPPPMVTEAIAELTPPNALWQPELWLEARNAVVESKGVQGLSGLFQCVRQSTERALQKKTYQIQTEVRHSLGIVDMSNTLAQVRKVQWFGRKNVDVPDALGELEGGAAGKIMPPPLIICEESPLEVLDTVRKIVGHERPIVVVTEVSDFDEAGSAELGRHRSMNPDCMPLRSDFNRFVDEAGVHLRSSNATMRQHLCAQNDPYVFMCPGVTVFRGSRDEGFPFMPEPHNAHVVAASMPNTRPAIQTVNSREGGSVWYAYRSDHTALLERYNLVGLVGLQTSPNAARAELLETGLHHENEEELPVLIVTALGCGNQGKPPRDAVATILKSWRRRFAPFYHSVYVCCAGRTGADSGLACYIDEIVNKSLYRISGLDSIAADMVAQRTMRWHWDVRELKLSCSRSKMEKAAHICRRVAEGKTGKLISQRRMTPSMPMSICLTSSRGTVSDPASKHYMGGSTPPPSQAPAGQQEASNGMGSKAVFGSKTDLAKRGSMFAEVLAGPRSAAQRRETGLAVLTQTRQDFGQELTSMLKSFSEMPEASPAASRAGSRGSEQSSSSDEMPPENALIGIQLQRPASPPTPGAEATAADLLKSGQAAADAIPGSRRTSMMIGGKGSRRSSRLDVAPPIGRRQSMLTRQNSKTLKAMGGEDAGRCPSPSTNQSYLTSLQLAGGLRNLCHQNMDRPRSPGTSDAGSTRGKKPKSRQSLLKKSSTMSLTGEKKFRDNISECGTDLTEDLHPIEDVEDPSEEEASSPTSARAAAKDRAGFSNLATLHESRDSCLVHNDSPFGSRQPSPGHQKQEHVEIDHRPTSRESAFSDCAHEHTGEQESAGAAEKPTAADASKQARRSSISRRKEDLLKNRDLPEAVQKRGRRGSTGAIPERMRRVSADLLKMDPSLQAMLGVTDEGGTSKTELDKEQRKGIYHQMMRRRSSLKGMAPSIQNAVGVFSNCGGDLKVSTLREGVQARRNSFSGFASPATSPKDSNYHEAERKRMRDLLKQGRRNSGSANADSSPSGGGVAAALAANARRNSAEHADTKTPSKDAQRHTAGNHAEASSRRTSAEVIRRFSQESRLHAAASHADPFSHEDVTREKVLAVEFQADDALFSTPKKSVTLNTIRTDGSQTKAAPPVTTKQAFNGEVTKTNKMVEDQVNSLAHHMEATLGRLQKPSGPASGNPQGSRYRQSLPEERNASGGKEAVAEALSARQRSSVGASASQANSSVGANPTCTRGSVGITAHTGEEKDTSRRSSADRHHSHEHVHFNGGDELKHRLSEHKRRKKGDSLTLHMLATSSLRSGEVILDDDDDPRSSVLKSLGRRVSALQTGVIGSRNFQF